MKTKLTFLTLLCFTLMGYARTTNTIFATYVPDDNFEQALINLGYDTGVLDNYVPTINITSVTSLDVSGKNIVDLTGIQDFVALTQLFCGSNKLTSLNVTTNTALTLLDCHTNQLSNLNISANTALTDLNCSSNLLTSLNIGTNTALTNFDCNTNKLTSLNVSTNTALIYLQLTSNLVTSLNVSTNKALTYIGCSINLITNLDVSTNKLLVYLLCSKNQLASLNVSANAALTHLDCGINLLTSLDVSNTAVTYLHCNLNSLTVLNVKNGNNINMPGVNFLAKNNPNLSCIQVDNVSYSTTNWTNIDAGVTFNTSSCALGTANFSLFDFQYCPNPVNNFLTLKANEPIDDVTVFNSCSIVLLF